MKKLLLLCLPLALICACSDKPHQTELIFDKTTEGLHIVSVKDTFNKFKGTYYISTLVKNSSKDKVATFLVKAKYIDGVGDIVAETSGGAGKQIAAGDSLLIENTYSFKLYKDLPYKVQLTVADMFK